MSELDERVKRCYEVYQAHGRNAMQAAKALGISRSTLRGRIALAERELAEKRAAETETRLPVFPDDDIPTSQIIASLEQRFKKRAEHHKSVKWFPVKVSGNDPIGIAFMGDPHLDDNGCNWPLLRRDCQIMNQPGIFGVNVGDTTNNWGGRLISQFANQDTSQATARKLAKWLLLDSGIKWLCWLMGNHDMNNDGTAILREMNAKSIPMLDWQAQFKVVFPNGNEVRVWVNHNFAGHSMWNTLHGAQKTAHMKEQADIYMSGHYHNWALHHEESASRDFTYWLGRCRGYKFIDDYAERHGHAPQEQGASVLAVIDPRQSGANRITCFADMEVGAEYLQSLRNRHGLSRKQVK